MQLRAWSAFGVPLPLALAPRIGAREWEEEGRFRFEVAASLPLVGEIVRYAGWLEPSSSPPWKGGAGGGSAEGGRNSESAKVSLRSPTHP
jgi:hypothetical protein